MERKVCQIVEKLEDNLDTFRGNMSVLKKGTVEEILTKGQILATEELLSWIKGPTCTQNPQN